MVKELTDGTWGVGTAGEVEFAAHEDGIDLLAVRPEEGWRYSAKQKRPNRLDVTFKRGNEAYELELRARNGVLWAELEHEIEHAEPGRWPVAQAGVVELAVEDDRLRLVGVEPAQGWTHRVAKQARDDVEVVFSAGGEDWELEAELDDGALEVETTYRVVGPLRGATAATTEDR